MRVRQWVGEVGFGEATDPGDRVRDERGVEDLNQGWLARDSRRCRRGIGARISGLSASYVGLRSGETVFTVEGL